MSLVKTNSIEGIVNKETSYKGKRVPIKIINDFITYWRSKKECDLGILRNHSGLEYLDFKYWQNLSIADKKFREIYGNKVAKELTKLIFNGLPYKITLHP